MLRKTDCVEVRLNSAEYINIVDIIDSDYVDIVSVYDNRPIASYERYTRMFKKNNYRILTEEEVLQDIQAVMRCEQYRLKVVMYKRQHRDESGFVVAESRCRHKPNQADPTIYTTEEAMAGLAIIGIASLIGAAADAISKRRR